jgi:hypothetical protein
MWNHRVVRRVYKDVADSETVYCIHEAFYNLDGTEHKPSITMEPDYPCGETIEELREDLQRMLRALDHPILDYETQEELKDSR